MIWFIQILYLLCGIEVNFIKAHTKGYKRKANSHCEKGKVTVLVSLEKRDLEAGEEIIREILDAPGETGRGEEKPQCD